MCEDKRKVEGKHYGSIFPCPHLLPRQVEILQLCAEGKTNKAIAFDLSISINTVKTHITTILAELQADNITQAVALGIHYKLIVPKRED